MSIQEEGWENENKNRYHFHGSLPEFFRTFPHIEFVIRHFLECWYRWNYIGFCIGMNSIHLNIARINISFLK